MGVVNVCLLMQSGKDLLSTSLSHFDPNRALRIVWPPSSGNFALDVKQITEIELWVRHPVTEDVQLGHSY
jgi:hypothetical protein